MTMVIIYNQYTCKTINENKNKNVIMCAAFLLINNFSYQRASTDYTGNEAIFPFIKQGSGKGRNSFIILREQIVTSPEFVLGPNWCAFIDIHYSSCTTLFIIISIRAFCYGRQLKRQQQNKL
jgi:hypothetical protein